LRDLLTRAISRVRPDVIRARIRAEPSVDATATLTKVRVPVLHLRATRDRVVPRAAADLILERCPLARVAELDAPHLLLQAAPVQAAALISDFSKGVAPASG